jgi:hypothetical protein
MTRIGISITKSTPFRNSVQEFSNVYYYDGLAGVPSTAEADTLIDQATTREKTFHSTGVSFVRGRLWTDTGNKATNEMVSQKNLSGTGSTTADATLDRERAVLFRLRAGSDSRGNPVYLRKWFHSCGQLGGVSFTAGIVSQTSGFSQANRDSMVSAMNSIGSIGSGTTQGAICAKGGRLPTAGATWSAHAFLEHHQFGDQWRAQ